MKKNKQLENFKRSLAMKVIPSLILMLIEKDLLGKDDLNDPNHIVNQIEKNSHLVEELQMQIITYDDYRKALKSEISAGRKESAIVMTSICIEHLLNFFYQDLLKMKFEMSSNEVKKALNLSIPTKVGWFLKMSADWKLSESLLQQVKQINSIRNKIVHYQAEPASFTEEEAGSYDNLEKSVSSVNLNNLEDITYDLEDELDEALHHAIPKLKLVDEICKVVFPKEFD